MIDFVPFPKISRLSRKTVVTEKIDGTNASIYIGEDGTFLTGSRTRWIVPGDDNFGFSAWAHANKGELLKLGFGHHFGEWWGKGIQRGYGLNERRFSLLNAKRWADNPAQSCCSVVPILAEFEALDYGAICGVMSYLLENGSVASPGFMHPEGVVVYHEASRTLFKKTFDKDKSGKGE